MGHLREDGRKRDALPPPWTRNVSTTMRQQIFAIKEARQCGRGPAPEPPGFFSGMARVFKGVHLATFKLSDETETGSNGVDLRFVRRFHGSGCHPFDATRAGVFHLWIFGLISAFELPRLVPTGTSRGPAGKLPTARSTSNHPTFQVRR